MWIKQATDGSVQELPKLVAEAVQRKLHGTSGVGAIRGALAFRRTVLRECGSIAPEAKLLDFGCGWGRHIRVFLKEFEPHNIYGVDIDPHNLETCRTLLPDVNFVQCFEHEPLKVKDQSIDLVISFSVFSHINEESAKRWLGELYRIIKPGGRAVLTSWGNNLFEVFDRIEKTGKVEYDWEKNIQYSFSDFADVRQRYTRGEFVFGMHGRTGGDLDPKLYGISLMPRQWVERESGFRLEKCLDNPKIVPQTTFVLERPAS
jgi:SAM-dependent methyltransferase